MAKTASSNTNFEKQLQEAKDVFKRLKNEGIIELNVNEVTILDMPQLLTLSGCLSTC